MTQNEKLLVATSLLPVLADLLEDCEFNRRFRQEANRIIYAVRYFDQLLLEGADNEEFTQQNDIQIAFRQWINEHFKDEEQC